MGHRLLRSKTQIQKIVTQSDSISGDRHEAGFCFKRLSRCRLLFQGIVMKLDSVSRRLSCSQILFQEIVTQSLSFRRLLPYQILCQKRVMTSDTLN